MKNNKIINEEIQRLSELMKVKFKPILLEADITTKTFESLRKLFTGEAEKAGVKLTDETMTKAIDELSTKVGEKADEIIAKLDELSTKSMSEMSRLETDFIMKVGMHLLPAEFEMTAKAVQEGIDTILSSAPVNREGLMKILRDNDLSIKDCENLLEATAGQELKNAGYTAENLKVLNTYIREGSADITRLENISIPKAIDVAGESGSNILTKSEADEFANALGEKSHEDIIYEEFKNMSTAEKGKKVFEIKDLCSNVAPNKWTEQDWIWFYLLKEANLISITEQELLKNPTIGQVMELVRMYNIAKKSLNEKIKKNPKLINKLDMKTFEDVCKENKYEPPTAFKKLGSKGLILLEDFIERWKKIFSVGEQSFKQYMSNFISTMSHAALITGSGVLVFYSLTGKLIDKTLETAEKYLTPQTNDELIAVWKEFINCPSPKINSIEILGSANVSANSGARDYTISPITARDGTFKTSKPIKLDDKEYNTFKIKKARVHNCNANPHEVTTFGEPISSSTPSTPSTPTTPTDVIPNDVMESLKANFLDPRNIKYPSNYFEGTDPQIKFTQYDATNKTIHYKFKDGSEGNAKLENGKWVDL